MRRRPPPSATRDAPRPGACRLSGACDAPEALFASIDPRPLASASLAQVHAATLADGRRVAVKIQHPGLRASCAADLAGAAAVARAVGWLTGGAFDFDWLGEQLRESLPLELDFRVEADNARRCAAALAWDTYFNMLLAELCFFVIFFGYEQSAGQAAVAVNRAASGGGAPDASAASPPVAAPTNV